MTRLKITIGFLAFLLMIASVWSLHTIYSNTVADHVTEYALGTLSKDSNGGPLYSVVTFQVQLKLGTAPISGATVNLYQSPDNSSWSAISTNTTEGNGWVYFMVNRTQVGDFYYRAGYDTP
jgi:hypothetical protein